MQVGGCGQCAALRWQAPCPDSLKPSLGAHWWPSLATERSGQGAHQQCVDIPSGGRKNRWPVSATHGLLPRRRDSLQGRRSLGRSLTAGSAGPFDGMDAINEPTGTYSRRVQQSPPTNVVLAPEQPSTQDTEPTSPDTASPAPALQGSRDTSDLPSGPG